MAGTRQLDFAAGEMKEVGDISKSVFYNAKWVNTACHSISLTATQLCHCAKAAMDTTELNGCGCVPVKLYSQSRLDMACSPGWSGQPESQQVRLPRGTYLNRKEKQSSLL